MLLKRAVLKVVEEKRSTAWGSHFLKLLSLGWRSILRLRNQAYDKQWLQSVKVPLPTISIGNIVVGGTGKTPLVQLLCSELESVGPVAILSRGYQSQIEKANGVVQISKGKGPLFSAAICGDEPYFLSQKTNAWIWVGPRRLKSAEQAIQAGARCLILDDGMQHRKLARDFEIVMIDANDPFGGGNFLPLGELRDEPRRLSKAHLIIASHTKDLSHYERVKKELSRYTPAPVVGMHHSPIEGEMFKGRRIAAFCGIGKPHYFWESLKNLGAEIVFSMTLLDHEPMTEQQLQIVAEQSLSQGAEWIVCTEKDWVKLSQPLQLPLPLVPLKMGLQVVAGRENWENSLQTIKQMIRKEDR